jgi:hypothetical protein
MKYRKAVVKKEWGEIGLGSSKRNGWAYEVTYYDWDSGWKRVDLTVHKNKGSAYSAARKWESRGFLYGGE